MSKRDVRPIPFGKNDSDIVEFLDKNVSKFATYVKSLIRADMKKRQAEKNQSFDKDQLKEIMIEILSEINSPTNTKAGDEISATSSKAKKAIRGFSV